ncbi:hypothetical protein E2C01_036938 [Portunus trituberculatus]|uniref:Secreted protein n=1 Tax=Portunus trituberculatus TaxID=210409 RepID=A0A5B7FFP8_PORTR|nr:hypothetical protein [Portunus trituberculatus]
MHDQLHPWSGFLLLALLRQVLLLKCRSESCRVIISRSFPSDRNDLCLFPQANDNCSGPRSIAISVYSSDTSVLNAFRALSTVRHLSALIRENTPARDEARAGTINLPRYGTYPLQTCL